MKVSASKIWNESNCMDNTFSEKIKGTYLAVTENVRFYRRKIAPMTCNAQTLTTIIDLIRMKYSINM